jgi:hypothetical protein
MRNTLAPTHNEGTPDARTQNKFPISASPGNGHFLDGLRRAWLAVYAAIWAATLAIAALVLVGVLGLKGPISRVIGARLEPDRNPPPQLAHVLVLVVHNLPIVAWPLLLGVVGAHRHPTARQIADVMVAACVTVNILIVGAALGAYGFRLLPYLPQLPLEWAGLALGASSWLLQRRRTLTLHEGLVCFGLIAIALLGAATLESVAVPHR